MVAAERQRRHSAVFGQFRREVDIVERPIAQAESEPVGQQCIGAAFEVATVRLEGRPKLISEATTMPNVKPACRQGFWCGCFVGHERLL